MAVTAAHRRAVALGSFLLGGKLQSAGSHLAGPSFGQALLALILLVSGNKKRLGTEHHRRAQVAREARQAAGCLTPA